MFDAAIWDTVFWGNTIMRWTVAAGIVLVLVVGLRIVATVIAKQFKRLAQRTDTDVDDLIADLLDKTKLLFIVIVAVWGASRTLEMTEGASQIVRVGLVLALLLQAGFWIGTIVGYFLTAYRKKAEADDPGVATAMGAVSFLASVAVWSVIFLVALDTLGIDITALIAGLGVGGIAIALAVQNVLGDLFASLSIILDKPFVVGDFIILGGEHLGTVEHVGLKTTRIRALSGEQLVISNSDLLSSRIRNFKRMAERRVVFEVGVTYGTPAEKLRQIPRVIREAVESCDNTRFDRSHFKAFGDSSLNFETVYYMGVPDYNSYMDTQQTINLALYERFEDLNVDFAFPTRTLFVRMEDTNHAEEKGVSREAAGRV
jgi:small-conductance mechanosensitive channel